MDTGGRWWVGFSGSDAAPGKLSTLPSEAVGRRSEAGEGLLLAWPRVRVDSLLAWCLRVGVQSAACLAALFPSCPDFCHF